MKKRKIMLIALFIAYLLISLFMPINSQTFSDRNDIEIIEQNIEKYGADKTKEINSEILSRIFQDYNRDRYIYLLNDFGLYAPQNKIKYYITNPYDVDKLMQEENIKNPKNLKIKKSIFNLPIEEKKYSHLFEEDFKIKKQEAKVIATDEKGYSKFDISPDTLLLATLDDNIILYAYIDNRLLDTREIMNKGYTQEQMRMKDMQIKDTTNNPYNKYKLVIVDDLEYKD